MARRQRYLRSRIGRFLAAGAVLGMLAGTTVAMSTAGAAGATLTSVQASGFGKVLSDGNTVYTLKPSSVACTAKCAKIWPAVLLPSGSSKPSAGSGVSASKLGSVKVKGGRQVTYGGQKLYFFFQDTAPGQVNGAVTDKWGKWSPVVLSKSGSGGSKSGTGGSNAGSGGVSF